MKVSDCHLEPHLQIEIGKSVTEAAKKLKTNKARHVYVTEKTVPIGVISLQDIVNDVVAEGKTASKVKVESIMKTPIYACLGDDNLADAYFKLAKHNIGCLPVLAGKKIKGLLTMPEIMKHLVKKGNEAK